ncbi:hypothetical protein [Nodosilinea sp. P-1105]|uniref:hypothetical protein n=1 Tax=Nodosilinea sp. P-1105 TaxID=2546229 RepID=UPI00146AF880|nr:hypothetical protein [Nodosilinea sp. P-1105]
MQRAEWKGDTWRVHCSTGAEHDCLTHLPMDRIWLATGSQLNMEHWPLLADVRATCPIEIVNGLSVLDHHLRWPGCNLFLMHGTVFGGGDGGGLATPSPKFAAPKPRL